MDNRRLVWLDLCSGLGGASQPAVDRGWRVIRVDIDPRFKPDIVADVRALPPLIMQPDVLWVSPPCIEFARLAMPWQRKRHPKLVETGPDLSIAKAARAAIDFFKPRWWVIENTIHSRKWLIPLLGHPTHNAGGHYFWAHIPTLLPDVQRKPKESYWPSEDRQALRAKIPYEIGEAICRAVETRQ